MKSLQVLSHDAPPEFVETAIPSPDSGEVLLKIGACGLNFADLLMIKGRYQDTPAVPFTLGLELSGTVEAVGEGVSDNLVVQRMAVYAGSGGLADYGCFSIERCTPIPDEMSFEQAAGFQIAYGTSHVGLNYRARLQPGETLVVLGAAGDQFVHRRQRCHIKVACVDSRR